jgi:hypothetical protein
VSVHVLPAFWLLAWPEDACSGAAEQEMGFTGNSQRPLSKDKTNQDAASGEQIDGRVEEEGSVFVYM